MAALPCTVSRGLTVAQLAAWVDEVLLASWPYVDVRRLDYPFSPRSTRAQEQSGLLHNYVDQPSTFLDASAVALLAAVSFRQATLGLGDLTLDYALTAYQTIQNAMSPETGVLSPVVNPYSFAEPLAPPSSNPEAQVFVLSLKAAAVAYVESTGDETIAPKPLDLPSTSRSHRISSSAAFLLCALAFSQCI